jgi:hypothetical protein
VHVRALSRRFRRPIIEELMALYGQGELKFFNDLAELPKPQAFAIYHDPLRKTEGVVYAKKPFSKPEAVLANLSHYSHPTAPQCSKRGLAISNSRLVSTKSKIVRDREVGLWRSHLPGSRTLDLNNSTLVLSPQGQPSLPRIPP